VNADMTTDPDQIRSTIATLLATLPESDAADADIEAVAARLEEAHDHLVGALEAVERGGSEGRSAATGGFNTEARSGATGGFNPEGRSGASA
jgi:hypothetical protein